MQESPPLVGYFDVIEGLRAALRATAPRGQSPFIDVGAATRILADCIAALRELGGVADNAAAIAAPPRHGERDALTSIADSCFLAQSELKPLLLELQRANAPDAGLAAVEATFRKLRRICTRLLMLLGPLVDRRVDLTAEQQEIVEASIAVRRLYTRFRRSLVPCDDDAQVPVALRIGASALSQILNHVSSHDIRVQDAQVFRSMLARVLGWLGDSGSTEAGRRIYSDLTGLADLLRLVNQRQELRAHDAEVIDAALSMCDADPSGGQSHALLMLLVPLEGLDDALDQTRERLTQAGTPESVAAVSERLSALQSVIR